MNYEDNILEFLTSAYADAKSRDDVEMMIRLTRAIIAFSYKNLDGELSWNKMVDAYMF